MKSRSAPVIFGEVLYDCFADGSQVLGGAPFNVAWHCQAFGLQPMFISRVGDDSLGEKIISAMHDWGLTTEGMQIDSEHPTGRVNVTFNNNEPSYDIVENSAWDYINSELLPQPGKNLFLYHGSLALRSPQSAMCLATLKQVISRSIFIDINLRPPWWNSSLINTIMQDSQWLKINIDELNLIVDSTDNTEVKARNLLSDLNLDFIVVTQGSAGAIAFTQDETYIVQPESAINVVDTIGAGDAFTSVLLLGIYKAWPLQLTIERAQLFASKVVGLQGATTQDKNFYNPFIKNWSL